MASPSFHAGSARPIRYTWAGTDTDTAGVYTAEFDELTIPTVNKPTEDLG